MKNRLEALIERLRLAASDPIQPSPARALFADTAAELDDLCSALDGDVERRARELAASRENRRREELRSSLATLAAGFAQQVNNPVSGIWLLARNALDGAGDPAAGDPEAGDPAAREPGTEDLRDEALRKIVRNCERCRDLTHGMRRLAVTAPRLRRSDLSAVVRSAVDLTSEYAREQGAALTPELAEDLPTVEIDAEEMEQVVVDLIRNAIEAAARTVTIRTEEAADTVRCVIRDDGHGMEREARRKSYDPFFTTRLHEGGIGLGLSVARTTVVASGGWIEIDSTPGLGTTVSLSLPVAGLRPARRSDPQVVRSDLRESCPHPAGPLSRSLCGRIVTGFLNKPRLSTAPVAHGHRSVDLLWESRSIRHGQIVDCR